MCIQVHQRKEGDLKVQAIFLGEAIYILGIQIIRDRKNKLLALSQASYIDKVQAQFSMQDSKKRLYRPDMELSFPRSNVLRHLKRKRI